jgi:uncharacterized membrane protein YkoI
MRTATVLAAAWLAILPCALAAQDADPGRGEQAEREHRIGLDEVNRLVGRGVIRRLSDVIATALRRAPGELIDADLLWRGGHYLYEVEILSKGRRVEIYVDAVTLECRGEE